MERLLNVQVFYSKLFLALGVLELNFVFFNIIVKGNTEFWSILSDISFSSFMSFLE